MRRRDFIFQGTLTGVGTWFAQRGHQVKAALARYGTAKYDSPQYGH